MNFLGHLYFSDNNPDLMYANLFGDFVKGRDLNRFSPVVRSGILLHRSIDHYIDHHPKVVELMHSLYSELPKVTGVAIDLFFDHLLAKNWKHFDSTPYNVFLNNFYQYIPIYWDEFSDEFKLFIQKMRIHQWPNFYAEFDGLQKVCRGVSSRLSFENELINAPIIFVKYEQEITNCFEAYMHDAIPYFQQRIKSFNL